MEPKKIFESGDITVDMLAQWYTEHYRIEVWKDIPGFEGLYQASTLGRIRSLNYRKVPGRIAVLSLFTQKDGYQRVNLHKGLQQKSYWVHILIAKTFLPNPLGLSQVNHKDENPSNNSVFNIEWCSPKHNCNWGTRNLRQSATYNLNKPNNGIVKATIQLTKDNAIVKEWASANDAANALGIHVSNIVRCCNHEQHYKTAGGYRWEYKDNLLRTEDPC